MTGASRLRWLVVAALAVAAAWLLDPWAVTGLALPSAGDRDWGRFLRIIGFAPTWGLVALILWLEGRGSREAEHLRSAALAIVIAVLLGGLGAEALKLVFRRERPEALFAGYSYRAFTDRPFSTRGLGLPSSHAMVAFAGAGAVAVAFPRIAWPVMLLAAGCALSRVFAHAHYLSDVTTCAFVGTWIGRWAAGRRLSAGAGQ